MGVFTAPPMSFKMDRKTPFASKLKSLIFDHLLHFCPDYSDDVLAEYITVLVCNGKDQNQAREDLEAFLGERNREFVSWLWRILLNHQLTAVIPSEQKDKIYSNPFDTYRENDNKNVKSLDLHGNNDSDNLMGEGEVDHSPTKTCKSYKTPISENHPHPPSNEKITKVVLSSDPQGEFANTDSSIKAPSSLRNHQTEGVDHSAERTSLSPRCRASLLGRNAPSLPRTDLASGSLFSYGGRPELCQMLHSASVGKRSLPPLPSGPSSLNHKPRQSVWDRLGKLKNDSPYRDQVTKRCIRKLREVHQIAEADRDNRTDDIKGVGHAHKTVPSVNNIRRKRQFGEVSNQTDSGTTVERSINNQSEEIIPTIRKPKVLLEGSQAVVSPAEDVKLRLRKVEIEMTKLRSKQMEMEKDRKITLPLDSGAVKRTDEDIKSKTVLVTNVHYNATREALSDYFQRCGAVTDVVFLTDETLPQRSAYITFESKESTNKALRLDGSIFYSRTITVSRKGDTAGVSSALSFGTKNFGSTSHLMNNAIPNRFSFPGSHLQWRRKSLSSLSESSATTCGLAKAAAESSMQLDHSVAPVSETV